MIKAEDVGVSIDGETLFAHLHISIGAGDKVGIVGPNGSGKSTLLRILAGLEAPSSGSVKQSGDEVVAISPADIDLSVSVVDHVGAGLGAVYEFQRQLDALAPRLAQGDPRDVDRYGTVMERFEQLDGWTKLAWIEAATDLVGLGPLDPERPIGTMSGGQLARATLARLLVVRPTVILLDEPTSHLDASGVAWLKDFLADSDQAVVVASYSRDLLNHVPDRIIELDDLDGTAHVYQGGYDAYLAARRDRDRKRRLQAQAQDKFVKRIEADIDRAKQRARSLEGGTRNAGIRAKAKGIAKQAKARQRRLKSFLDSAAWVTDVPEQANRKWVAASDPAFPPGSLSLEKISVSYGDVRVLDGLSIAVRAGDRVLVQGDNGSGKTTMIKAATGVLDPDSGRVSLPSGPIVVLPQHLDLPLDVAPLDYFRREIGIYVEDAQEILNEYMFDFEMWSKPIDRLSRGEQRRLQLATAFNKPASVLVLDEPTNYLDFEGLDLLDRIVPSLTATTLVVSHDPYLEKAFRPTQVIRVADGHAFTTST